MGNRELSHDEAIRKLLSRTRMDQPSDDFTSRIMERIEKAPEPAAGWIVRYQWLVLLFSLSVTIFLLFFPVWSWFNIEFTPGRFILFYAAEGFRWFSVWLGTALSHLGTMGPLMYLLPVSVAILLLVALDQAIRKPGHSVSRA